MNLETALGPQNDDLDLTSGDDLTAAQYRAVWIDGSCRAHLWQENWGTYPTFCGIVQNAPNVGETARIRTRGFSYVQSYALIGQGALLTPVQGTGPTDDGKLIKLDLQADGHRHSHEDADLFKAYILIVFHVADSGGSDVTGLVDADFASTELYYQDSQYTLATAAESYLTSELGSGWYVMRLDTTYASSLYHVRLKTGTSTDVISPPSWQGMATPTIQAPPEELSTRIVVAQAVQQIPSGEIGIALLRNHIW